MINNAFKKPNLNKWLKLTPIVLFAILFFSLFILTLKESYTIDNNADNSNDLLIGDNLPVSSNNHNSISNNLIEIEDSTPKNLTNEEIEAFSYKSYDERLNLLHNQSISLKDRIIAYLGSDIDSVGLIYYNLDNEENIKINEDNVYTAASVYKVGLNMYTYYLVNNGRASLDDVVYYIESDFEDGSGILQFEDYIGGRTVQELLDLSIIYSDNIASNMLWRYLGGYYTFKYGLYDLIEVDFDVIENTLTPNMEFKILKYIYDNKSNPNFAHLIETMKSTIFNDRLDKYIPSHIVAHKIGDYGSASNDVGIIFTDSPYILLIFTDGIGDSYEKIGQISKAIYDYNIK